jgi:hypothetical protein
VVKVVKISGGDAPFELSEQNACEAGITQEKPTEEHYRFRDGKAGRIRGLVGRIDQQNDYKIDEIAEHDFLLIKKIKISKRSFRHKIKSRISARSVTY